MGQRGIASDNVEERLPKGKGHAMERIEPKGRTLLSVRRGYVRSRLELEFLACAYERVVPEIGKAVVGRHQRSEHVAPNRPVAAGASS